MDYTIVSVAVCEDNWGFKKKKSLKGGVNKDNSEFNRILLSFLELVFFHKPSLVLLSMDFSISVGDHP